MSVAVRHVAAEDLGLLRNLIAHGVGAYGDSTVGALADNGAAAQADGQDVRHAEVGAHAADGHSHAGFPGKPFWMTPRSVVVPPTSMTMAFCSLLK